MKFRAFIALASASCLLSACLSVKDAPSVKYDPAHDGAGCQKTDGTEKSPAIGMSQNQLRDIYGEPDSVDRSPCCEVWNYSFQNCRVFIPGGFRSRARNGVFIFGGNGKLKDFGFNQ